MKTVTAKILKQKQVTLYYFTMDAKELEPLCFVEAAARDRQKGLQRVTEVARLKEIGEFLASGANSLLPNSIILNLKENVAVKENGDGTAAVTFPTDEGDYAFVVDGQHRLFSFRDEYRRISEDEVFELAVVALHNASEELVGETFVQINVNQKPVNRDLLIQMKAILGLLDTDIEKACIDLIHELDDAPDSPLKDRILRFPKEKNKWVKVGQLLPIVKGLLQPGGPLYEKTHAERKRLLIAYFQALSETFPDAWADERRASYSLLQPAGLQMMLALLPDVMQRCDFHESFSYSVETFKRQLEPVAGLALLGNWGKTAVAEAISIKIKREMLLGQLKEALKVRPPI